MSIRVLAGLAQSVDGHPAAERAQGGPYASKSSPRPCSECSIWGAQGACADGSAGLDAARAEASALRCQLEGFQARERELTAQARPRSTPKQPSHLQLHLASQVLQPWWRLTHAAGCDFVACCSRISGPPWFQNPKT